MLIATDRWKVDDLYRESIFTSRIHPDIYLKRGRGSIMPIYAQMLHKITKFSNKGEGGGRTCNHCMDPLNSLLAITVLKFQKSIIFYLNYAIVHASYLDVFEIVCISPRKSVCTKSNAFSSRFTTKRTFVLFTLNLSTPYYG